MPFVNKISLACLGRAQKRAFANFSVHQNCLGVVNMHPLIFRFNLDSVLDSTEPSISSKLPGNADGLEITVEEPLVWNHVF